MSQVLVGIDLGRDQLQVYAENDQGEELSAFRIGTDQASLDSLVQRLKLLAPAHEVQIALEEVAGRAVHALLEGGFHVKHINPKKVERGREMLAMSGAKDDRRDALVQARMLRLMPESCQALTTPDPILVQMRRATRLRKGLVGDRTAVTNQLKALLHETSPQIGQILRADVQWVGHLWDLIATVGGLEHLEIHELRDFLKSHRVRKFTAEELMDMLQVDNQVEEGLAEAARFECPVLFERLGQLNKMIARIDRRLDELVKSVQVEENGCTDADIVNSLPGAGLTITATVLAEGLPPLLTASLDAGRCYAGVAPVAHVTGKRQQAKCPRVFMRRACNRYLRDVMHQMAERAVREDSFLAARYASYRAHGFTHGRACRQIADRQLRCLRAMLRDRTLYTAR